VIIFRMTATMMTLDFLSAPARRWEKEQRHSYLVIRFGGHMIVARTANSSSRAAISRHSDGAKDRRAATAALTEREEAARHTTGRLNAPP
jgi:hypothetical protein